MEKHIYQIELQLGRGLSTAERRGHCKAHPTSHLGFNWAAVFRPRKGRAELNCRRRERRASIGPRSFDRGKRNGEQRRHHPHLASIGPRSFDRGKATGRRLCIGAAPGLQLGRGLSTAESSEMSEARSST